MNAPAAATASAAAAARTRPLARSLMLQVSAAVVLCLIVLGGAFQLLVLQPAIGALSDGELRRVMTRVDDALQVDFGHIGDLLAMSRGWGQSGRLRLDDVDGFNQLLMPVLRHNAQISSVLFASEAGREILLLRRAGGWHNRLTLPENIGRSSVLQARDATGRLLEEEEKASGYDPRVRPWFRGAMALEEEGTVHLTPPYLFYTTGDPGVTVSTRWTTADGTRLILAFDLLLSDLSKLTQALHIGEVGGAAIVTVDDRVLGLPWQSDAQPEGRQAVPIASQIMGPVEAASAHYLRSGHRRWSELGRPAAKTFDFSLDGEAWIGHFRPLDTAGTRFWVGGFARRSDFVPARLSDLALLGLLIGVVGIIGAFMALRLAFRIGQPLQALCEQSERIGQLDLEPGARIRPQWTEIERLAEAQDRMRAQLHAAARELGLVQDTTITALASLAETRDGETGRHLRRTQAYVRCLAEALREHPRFRAELTPQNIELLVKSAPLHDIGKVGVPDRILMKPGALEREELEIMQAHTTLGRDAIAHAEASIGESVPFLRLAKEVAYSHQEKWDGSGYPQGLEGDQIPVSARLMAVADVYDALISRRIYKRPHSHEEAVAFMRRGSGSHFDPDVVEAFVGLQERFRDIARENADREIDLEIQRRHLELVFGRPLPAEHELAEADRQTASRR